MRHVGEGGPAYLLVARNEASQRRAAAALIRPAEVAPAAARLSLWGASWPAGDLVAWWLGGLRYIDDPPMLDVWRAPRATISLGGGDCEDLSIAALSLLIALGGSGALVVGTYFSHNGPIGHAWMEGWDGAGWLHLDATNRSLTRWMRPPEYVPMVAYSAR